jgi:anti-anti-sigma regulatory factor
MQTGLTIYVGSQRVGIRLSLRGSCTGPAEAAHLKQVVAQVIDLGCTALIIDCQHVALVSTQGQQAILHVEQQAATARVPLYWSGLSQQLIDEFSATGLYGLLRSAPAPEKQDGIEEPRLGMLMPFIAS